MAKRTCEICGRPTDEVQKALEELATEGTLAKTENVNKIPMFYPTAQKS